MIHHIPSKERFTADHGWLKSRFSFSFAEYHDPSNLHFGPLRVFNDDIVQPSNGFGMHPHRDMEIVTYVISGQLEHKDSMGHIGVLRPGDVQRMTAGTGIVHSEYNPSDQEPVHFLQIWILPEARSLPPAYDQRSFPLQTATNRLIPLVSGGNIADTLHIKQDAVFYAGKLEADTTVHHSLTEGRRGHLFVIEGEVQLNEDIVLQAGDAARIYDEAELRLHMNQYAHVLFIDLGPFEG